MIVLTGGAGFIGSCFLKKLNDEGITDILVVDHLGNKAKWKNLSGKKFADYLHKDDFRKLLEEGKFNGKIHSVVHLGACSATTETDADYLMNNNFVYSRELGEFCDKNKIRFIYASSAATYGNGEFGYSDKSIDGLRPLNCYGLTKHLFDQWVFAKKLDTKFTGIKFFNVFGPNEYHKGSMMSMVYKSYKQISESGKVKLFKSYNEEYQDGGQLRDFIYVKDTVEIMFKMLYNEDFTGIYNLGTGQNRSWNDLANAAFSAMNKMPNIEYIDMSAELTKQYQNYTKADTNKLMSKLGEFSFTSLEDSVADYINNYLSNENQYL